MMVKSYLERDIIAQNFADNIRKLLDVELLILFGSTAKRMDLLNSDVDIALIGKKNKLNKVEKEKIADVALNILLENGIVINWLYIPMQKWKEGLLPIITEIKTGGKILWQKEKTEKI